ncbi:MAG: DUF3788 domain-containing protein [Pirellulales bacterium]|nr:DUF3788 domain-containing protein [Pirellulales bacterium]
MEESVLSDAQEYPSDDILRLHLGRAMASWQALVKHVEQHDPDLNGQWRYYKDGKSWLYKVTHKKLTLCWVAVFKGRFKTTCYFPDRAESAITGSNLPKAYIDQYLSGPRYGNTRAISVDVRKLADLKVTKEIMKTRLLVK